MLSFYNTIFLKIQILKLGTIHYASLTFPCYLFLQKFKMVPAPTSSTTTMTTTPPPKTKVFPATEERVRPVPRKTIWTLDDSSTVPVMDRVVPTIIVWRNVALFAYLHLAAVYGGFLLVTGQVMWQTFLWGTIRFPFFMLR